MSNRELWQNALVQIELGTSQASFRTWFRNTDIASREAGVVHVAVPSKIVKEWLMEKHHKLVLRALRSLDDTIRTVEYSVRFLAPEMPDAGDDPASLCDRIHGRMARELKKLDAGTVWETSASLKNP